MLAWAGRCCWMPSADVIERPFAPPLATIAVLARGPDDSAAAALAARLGLPLGQGPGADAELLLSYTEHGLQLQPVDGRCGAVRVDFDGAALRHRLQGGAELVAKAVRGRSREPLRVVDATAGLGRDALVLAARGFAVTMVERSPVVAALLEDGLMRAVASSENAVAAAAKQLDLVCADAVVWLGSAAPQPDVIYLDPMFPDERKSALPRKEMQLFQLLLAHGAEDPALLVAARQAARIRVVVKRPVKGPPLAGVEPAYELSGKAVRFDVYLPA